MCKETRVEILLSSIRYTSPIIFAPFWSVFQKREIKKYNES